MIHAWVLVSQICVHTVHTSRHMIIECEPGRTTSVNETNHQRYTLHRKSVPQHSGIYESTDLLRSSSPSSSVYI